ncbi:MAG: ABC-F family ATP-binding cassette domain-containing protein [Bacteroidales bacterium]|nr:ABC-F family ATP-binding cassette domain-containing protein [Bacteroidales bacterium]
MVSIQNLSVSFGSFDLLTDISFLINEQDRIGLAGKNGAGKSTLLKIIAGKQSPTSGSVNMPKDVTIGYLPQHMNVDNHTTIMNEALSAFSDITELSKEIDRCTKEISIREDYESEEYLKLCDHLTVIEERYRILGGSNYLAEIEKALIGLGFEREDFDRPTKELSGGWRMRVELAKILLRKPNLFLLDEPTNHLDIESIQWLESFLSSYKGAVLLVSHDKAFLDNVTNRTIEISCGKIYDYKVSWSKFTELRKERRESQIAAFKNQQKMIEDTEKFIERFRYKPTKSVQVQSRIKQLDKLERIEIDEEDFSVMNLRFPPAPRSGTNVVEAEGICKSFGDKLVLDNIDFKITRGEKIAFVGRNGEGKTTFSKIIIGLLDHDGGTMHLGHNVQIGYFAQNQDELLDEEKTVFDTVDEVAKGDMRTKVRDMLGAFLFSGEDIDKKVKVLSGGERSRLSLVRMLFEPFNLLVLDEPTNHLDMRSKDILKQAILKYDGTVIVVSHDRDFLDGVVSKVYEFRNHGIKEYLGGIYDFLRKKNIDNLRAIEIKDAPVKQTEDVAAPSSNKQRYLEKKEYDRTLRKLKKQVDLAEKEIENIEQEIKYTEEKLNSPTLETQKRQDLYEYYKILKKSLDTEMERWEQFTNDYEVFIKENN